MPLFYLSYVSEAAGFVHSTVVFADDYDFAVLRAKMLGLDAPNSEVLALEVPEDAREQALMWLNRKVYKHEIHACKGGYETLEQAIEDGRITVVEGSEIAPRMVKQ